MIKPKIIKSDDFYEAALARIDALMNARPGSPEEEELELWSVLAERYEEERFPMDPPDPIDAIRFRMEQQGLKPKDLTEYIPNKSKISELLNRKRRLSLPMIRSLNAGLGIPADVLVREIKTGKKKTAGQKAKSKAKQRSARKTLKV